MDAEITCCVMCVCNIAEVYENERWFPFFGYHSRFLCLPSDSYRFSNKFSECFPDDSKTQEGNGFPADSNFLIDNWRWVTACAATTVSSVSTSNSGWEKDQKWFNGRRVDDQGWCYAQGYSRQEWHCEFRGDSDALQAHPL